MHLRTIALVGCLLSCLTPPAAAQRGPERSFTLVSDSCEGVRWSDAALKEYPNIASACQGVEERDGRSFVRFQGTVVRNANRGQQLTMNFKDGGEITLTPPEETVLYLNGRRTPVASLRRGDDLTFFIAEDRLAAQFYAENESPATTIKSIIVPIRRRQPMASDEQQEVAATLPETASYLPTLAFFGVLALALGAGLTWREKRRRC